MLASYVLSRTLVPTLAMYSIKGHSEAPGEAKGGFFLFSWASAFQRGFERRFESFREGYRDLLSLCLSNGRKVIFLVMGFVLASCLLFPFLGQDFFPAVDAGRFDMHVRMKSGTRIEETARTVDEIEQMIRKIISADQLGEIIATLVFPTAASTPHTTTPARSVPRTATSSCLSNKDTIPRTISSERSGWRCASSFRTSRSGFLRPISLPKFSTSDCRHP